MIKVAVLWLINENNELLLAQRAHRKAQDPGAWGPAAAGKLEQGETFDDALIREVEEELALKQPTTPLIFSSKKSTPILMGRRESSAFTMQSFRRQEPSSD